MGVTRTPYLLTAVLALLCAGCPPPHAKKDEELLKSAQQDFRNEGAGMANEKGLKALAAEEYRKALQFFQQACVLDPETPTYFNNLGRTWYFLGEHRKALDALNQAQKLRPADPRLVAGIATNIGDCLRELGRFADAAQYYNIALEQMPGLARAHYEYGTLHQKRGDSKSALFRFNKALKIDPQFDRARLARLILLHLLQRDTDAWQDLKILESRGFEVKEDLRQDIIRGLEKERADKRFRPGR